MNYSVKYENNTKDENQGNGMPVIRALMQPALTHIIIVGELQNMVAIKSGPRISYGKHFLFKYDKPIKCIIQQSEIISVARMTYDLIKVTNYELPRGPIQKLFNMKPRLKWSVEKNGEMEVDRVLLRNGSVVYAKCNKTFNFDTMKLEG